MNKVVSEFIVIISSILFLMFTVFALLAIEYIIGGSILSKTLLSTATWAMIIIAGSMMLGVLCLVYYLK